MSESERMADLGKPFTALDEARYASYAINEPTQLEGERQRQRGLIRRSPYYVKPPIELTAQSIEAGAAIIAQVDALTKSPPKDG